MTDFYYRRAQRLDEGTGEPADEVPDTFAGEEEMVSHDEHAQNDEGEDDGEKRPGFDVAGIIGGGLGAHDGKEIAWAEMKCNLLEKGGEAA